MQPGKKSANHLSTLASKTATTSKENAESANTEKSAEDVETAHTPTQATCTNPTQHAHGSLLSLETKNSPLAFTSNS